MAGTATFPDVASAANHKLVTIRVVDASGDKDAVSFYCPVATTNGQIDDIATDYQAATQASVYEVHIASIWSGDSDPDNANTDQRNSVKQGINLGFKNISTNQALEIRVVAPVPEDMQGNQDIPLIVGTPLETLLTDTLEVITGFSAVSAQYTERRERKNNPKIAL
jgi:hypothetical protein